MTVKPHLAWQYRDPATLIGRRCIAITRMDVTLDGTLDLIRLSPVHAVLKYCGTRKLVIERPGRTIGILKLTYWIFRCSKCPGAVMIDAPDGDAKTAIRKWNQYANGQWRKQ